MGFHYKDWLGTFFPNFCPEKDFLRFYASQLGSVEIDRTFHKPPDKETIQAWDKATPDSFLFSLRVPKEVTVSADPAAREEAIRSFVKTASVLGPKLGPVKLQFSSKFGPQHCESLSEVLNAFPADQKLVVQLHNPECYTQRVFDELAMRGAVLCLVDMPNLPRESVQTGKFVYIHIGGDKNKIDSDFSFERDAREDDLSYWAEIIEEAATGGKEVFVYCDNYFSGHAPSTVQRLRRLLSIS